MRALGGGRDDFSFFGLFVGGGLSIASYCHAVGEWGLQFLVFIVMLCGRDDE